MPVTSIVLLECRKRELCAEQDSPSLMLEGTPGLTPKRNGVQIPERVLDRVSLEESGSGAVRIFLARPYGWLFNVSLTFRSQRAYTPCTNSLTIR